MITSTAKLFFSQSLQEKKPTAVPARTLGDLVLLLVTARYEKGIDAANKISILSAGERYGLIDERGERTAKFYALVNDDVERLARELTGKTKQAPGLCSCGCGRAPRPGRKFAARACLRRFNATPKITPKANEQGSTCACGCGRPVFDRQKWASPGCQKKMQREKISDAASLPCK